ncbi:DnaD domain protein [Enterococcus faecalis]|uniref:DnaD domain protein n=2 Tax=Enterococcus faecalis TaxID=1351 RepID=A0A7H0FN23_ENTFL|nr:DnaD domain protein [Enterococcus faecalis]EOI00881.1 DnaD domain-containing protein [Enterococcus faecalis EnGen0237]EOI11709.1 DnaD domain-containing protein [Enterococcus faecalis EnGen0243]EOL45631.1 DnaD domain-containing protein [Enterococcus faecalis EnGen0238]NSR10362.1 DnaD domain protein [Enterococcus faecalis]NSR34988.1 DnaD domain protein [Enterococcus faecalis]
MNTGYIKLYRKVTNSFVWTNSDMFKLWILCLMKASHEDRKFLFNGQEVRLTSGQFVTGAHAIAKEYNEGVSSDKAIAWRTLWRWLKKFENEELLTIQSNARYSVITIKNWSDYQSGDKPLTSQRQSSDKPLTTYKNEKNDKNEKNINNNNKGSSIRSIWENNGFGPMSSKTMTDFDYWISDFEKIGASQKDAEQLIIKAIEIAIDANARNYNYINAILIDWERRGFKSVEEREAARKQKKTTKQQKSNTGHSDYDDLGF